METFAFGGLAPSTQEEGLTEVGKPEKPFALPYAAARRKVKAPSGGHEFRGKGEKDGEIMEILGFS